MELGTSSDAKAEITNRDEQTNKTQTFILYHRFFFTDQMKLSFWRKRRKSHNLSSKNNINRTSAQMKDNNSPNYEDKNLQLFYFFILNFFFIARRLFSQIFNSTEDWKFPIWRKHRFAVWWEEKYASVDVHFRRFWLNLF